MKLRILQVCPGTYDETGGVSVHVQNISERLALKHDVTVYAANKKSRLPWRELKNGVKVERFKCLSPNNAYHFSWEMLSRLRRVGFDIVHAHSYHAFPFHFSVFANCKKLIVTPHYHGAGHTIFRNALIRSSRFVGGITLKKANKIIAVSEYEKSLILRHFKIDVNKVVVIPNGIDYHDFSNLKKQKRGFKSILYVGYLIGYKGANHLIEVLPKLEDDIILEIVGNGPLKPYLEKRALQLQVYDRIRFYENLSRQEILQKFVDANMLVLLSEHEAYSMVVAEALMAKTPCLLAKASALSEWIDNKTCFGLNLPIKMQELEKQIHYILNNSVDRCAMEKWKRAKIPEWNEVVNRLEKIYFE